MSLALKLSKILFSILFFCGVAVLLRAQTNEFEKGGYISLSGDTTYGYIQDRLKISQSDRFYFKSDPAQKEAQQFSPEQVAGFFYAPNFRFRSMTITRAGMPIRKFLRQLVTGYAELYEYNSTDDPLYVLTKASGESVQLERRDSIIGGRINYDKRYEGLLKYTLKDCEKLMTSSSRIDFTQGTLAGYVRRYNECAHPEQNSEVLTTSRKLRVNLGLAAGKDFIKTHANNYNVALPKSEGTGDGIQVGLIAHFSYFENLALRTGLLYHRFDFNQNGTYSLGSFNYSHHFETLDIPVNLRYQFGKGKISPFVYGGIKVPIFLDKTLTTQKIELGKEVDNTESEIVIIQSLFFNAGLGTTLKLIPGTRLNLHLGYEQWNVEMADIRTFETNGLVLSAEVMF